MAQKIEAIEHAVPGGRQPQPLYAKLTPGPGRSASEVALNQRARLHGAMIQVVAERGYGAVTVRGLSRLAGVSTRTFYEHFADTEECFLRTHEFVVQSAIARITASQSGERDWLERLRLAFEAFVHEVDHKPQAARLALVEALFAGPAAVESVQRSEKVFEAMVSDSFARSPHGIEMPPLLLKGIVTGVSSTVRRRLLDDRGEELTELPGELLQWALSFHDEAVAELGDLERRSAYVSLGSKFTARKRRKRAEKYTRDEDDRDLILTATAKLAAGEGYRWLTVQRIRAAAGVPLWSFSAHFGSVEECFLAALEARTGEVFEDAAAHAADAGSWPGGIHRSMTALCTRIASDPVLAKLAFVEVLASGADGTRCRESLATQMDLILRGSVPPEAQPSRLAAEASLGAIWSILHHYVSFGRSQQLPSLAPTLTFLALAPVTGAPVAVEAIRSELAAARSTGGVKRHYTKKLDRNPQKSDPHSRRGLLGPA